MSQDHAPPQSLHNQPNPTSPPMPIDPALGLYPQYYNNYGQQHHHHHQHQHQQTQQAHLLPHHLSGPLSYSSPSSQASDPIGTPPMDAMYTAAANANGKRASIGAANNDSRKKARRDEESDVAQSPTTEKEEPKPKPTRGSRACTVCRRLKMKCVGAEQGPPCKRCVSGNHECIFEESNRGKRSSKQHELLSRSLRKMEKTLDTVLRSIGNPSLTSGLVSRTPSPPPQAGGSAQPLIDPSPTPPPAPTFPTHAPSSPKLHSLPDNSLNPLGLLAEASLANRRSQNNLNNTTNDEDKSKPRLGVASDNYFKPGPMTILPLRRLYIERQIQPEMLSFVSTEEVVALFNIYFDHIHMHCNLLDRNFHTPSLVCSRSPFLLTTICSIASKFYTAKPELHPKLTELAKKLAFSVPAKGYKSVEIVQGYLLLALWGCGAVERYEQDKTWLLLGMAIRMGTDLNLHRKTAVTSADTTEGKARDIEVHNRERTWILCFCLDRSFSAQMGKPNSIKEDFIIRNATKWCRSPISNPCDMSLVSYAELQRILSRSLDFLYSGTDSPSGLQTNCDYLLVIKTFETQMHAWRQHWMNELERTGALEETPFKLYKHMMARFYFNYAMLVLNSFGLQDALEREPLNIGHFFARCHTSAIACATIVKEELGPSGVIKFSPDSHFVQISYAVLSLLKLIRPEFQAFLENEQETLQLVKDVADVLDKIAANPLHTPALYSGFLRALISAKLEPQTFDEAAHHDSKPFSEESEANAPSQALASGTQGLHQNGFAHPPPPTQQSPFHQHGDGSGFALSEFQFDGEMGPVADISTFPPTMAPPPPVDEAVGALTMENILSSGFWDSMLVPGYNSLDGFSGGFVFGTGGSGLITPRFGMSPAQSGTNTPGRIHAHHLPQITQNSINAAFSKNQQLQDGVKIDAS
ncbi:hypothetical protein FA15DRAFT_581395 [Coprinopsis marcescibilis]|uniref:Zn(2)-C6 fungal-type domain-containing protein n=1 Tax=Coprinopsis marcescibilis TaxID=230819 RepID=A0A5C3LE72_COPMA|nr:hypothetical protein FA15DRAFT_581395 [Coprinopsis marcescibilis]